MRVPSRLGEPQKDFDMTSHQRFGVRQTVRRLEQLR
jgi:hypothetical protein